MLGIEVITTTKTLFLKGYSKTQISGMLGIDRKTVGKILKEPEEKIGIERKKVSSILDPYVEYINIQIAKKLSAMRIYQDMKAKLNYTGSYDTVKRYAARIKHIPLTPYMVLSSLPGEEAQVDFGYIGTIRLKDGRYKKAWIFVMELSYSRYMYARIVFEQSVATFIACHKYAFRYLGGIPQSIKLDNLKAGVLEVNFYESTIQRNYAEFASQYGFLATPCRVKTPTDKGKVESNIKYVKQNCFKGREFVDIEEAEKFLEKWLETIANVRVHGTTKKVPLEVFNSIEKHKLLPLPTEDYIIPQVTKCTVMPNCHITYQRNYYSVPYMFIGEEVEVFAAGGFVMIIHRENQIALHPLVLDNSGVYNTNKSHYPDYKNRVIECIVLQYKEEIVKIGWYALVFFERFMQSSTGKYDYRTISGILSLRKRYDNFTINNACRLSLIYGSVNYKTVKKVCLHGEISIFNPSKNYIDDKNQTSNSERLFKNAEFIH